VITLRRHQVEASDAVEAAWRSGVRRPLVDACVAAGKSLMFAELARREILRGGRVIIAADRRELVEQNANACRMLMPGMHVGVNAAALGERTWRAPVISAAIQSVYKYAPQFGPVTMLLADEAHLWPHSESGMYRELYRALGDIFMAGASGTVFRLNGGSLVEGEEAPFDRVVYTYSILDGIRDGYLCPAFSLGADDKMDPTKLRVRKGEFTSESSDAQMLAAMDNHIAQMVHHGADRRAWLVFEAGTKAAEAMARRMGEWGIPTGLVLGTTSADARAQAIDAFRVRPAARPGQRERAHDRV
jgi:DNA repair protein RadD